MESVLQLVRFGLVGVLATAVHYVVALGVSFFTTPYLANFAGYCTAVSVSYLGHHRFTFNVAAQGAAHGRRMPRFIVTSLSALILTQAVLAATIAAGLSEPVGLALAVLCVPPYTFVLSRFWVFT